MNLTATSRLGVLLLVVLLAASGCDDADPGTVAPPGTPPALIIADAFSFDTESFARTALRSGEPEAAQGPNHSRAFLTVLLVDLAVGVHLVLPSALTGAAGQDTPHVENGTWIWETTTKVLGSTIDVRLEGTPSGTEVDWELFITTENFGGQAYDNFVLYTATTEIGGDAGTWSLFYNIEDQGRTRVLDAEYLETGSLHELTFTIPETNPNQEARGASVTHMADGDLREFDYQEPAIGQNHLIEWDAVSKAGSITAWNYNDGERACWDEDLEDVPCEPTL